MQRGRRRHRPSARSSPSAVSRSRSRAASSGRQAGYLGVAGRRRGVQLNGGQAERALERAGGDVDELHPGVRDDRQPPDQQPVPDQQVLVALGVPPGPDGPDGHDRPPDSEQNDQSHPHVPAVGAAPAGGRDAAAISTTTASTPRRSAPRSAWATRAARTVSGQGSRAVTESSLGRSAHRMLSGTVSPRAGSRGRSGSRRALAVRRRTPARSCDGPARAASDCSSAAARSRGAAALGGADRGMIHRGHDATAERPMRRRRRG